MPIREKLLECCFLVLGLVVILGQAAILTRSDRGAENDVDTASSIMAESSCLGVLVCAVPLI